MQALHVCVCVCNSMQMLVCTCASFCFFYMCMRTHAHTHKNMWVPVWLCALVHGGFLYRSETGQHIRSIKWVLWVCGSNIDSSKVNFTPQLRGQRWRRVREQFGYLMALWKASLSATKIINGAMWEIRQVHIKLCHLDIDTDYHFLALSLSISLSGSLSHLGTRTHTWDIHIQIYIYLNTYIQCTEGKQWWIKHSH